MITSKQRAYLRSMANQTEPIIYVGKAGITDNLIEQVSDALVARELIKGTKNRKYSFQRLKIYLSCAFFGGLAAMDLWSV